MLSSSSKYWSLVIDSVCKVSLDVTHVFNERELFQYFKNSDVLFFALIQHNAECEGAYDGENYRHFHIVLELDNSRTGKSIANQIARDFGINFVNVHYRVVRSMTSICNYITHTGERWLNKEQFSIDNVLTNDREKFLRYRDGFGSMDLSVEMIEDLCTNTDDLLQVYRSFGLKNLLRYKKVVDDIDYLVKSNKTCLVHRKGK